jgi:hypothetical protein
MAQWQDLPHEVVLRFIEEIWLATCNLRRASWHPCRKSVPVKSDPKMVRWIQVNKQIQILFQSLQFKNFSIDFDEKPFHKTFNTIIYSQFKPGKWVNSIQFDHFTPPRTAAAAGEDPLYQQRQTCDTSYLSNPCV